MARPLHNHPLYEISSIGRPIDPRFPSNKAIMIVCAVALVGGAVWGGVQDGTLAGAAAQGLSATLTVFLAWALGRELDPDVNRTAFIAVAFAVAVWAMLGASDLWITAATLGLTRIVNRTVGPPAKLTDSCIVAGVIAFAVLWAGHWTLTLAAAIAFALDAVLPEGRKRQLVFGAIMLALLGWVLLRPAELGGTPLALVMPTFPLRIGALVLVYAIAVMTLPPVESTCDLPDHPLRRRRVQGGMVIALLVAVLAQFETARAVGAPTLLGVLTATVLGRLLPRRTLPKP
jgi:hypothetical protein